MALTPDGNTLCVWDKFVVDCRGLKGKRALVRIVDEAMGGWGHINFGGIYEDPLQPYRE